MNNIEVLETKKSQDNQLSVEYLTRMLEQAKAGELVQFCAIAKYSDGDYRTIWTRNGNLVEVSGMLFRLQYQVQQEMDPEE